MQKQLNFITLFIITIFLSSCGSRKEIVYFQNAKNFETMVDTESFNPIFKVNDIVSIYVSTFDLDAVKPFNLVRETGGRSGNEVDYLIDKDGYIDYPVLGKIKLAGLSVEKAKELFKEKLTDYLKDPIINIRILNFRVTIAGEVKNPGTYLISGERVTILEALGLAGDLTIKGKRDNILVVRDFDGTKTFTRIDLTTKEFMNSPVYYLTQNDYVYVEPNKSAISASALDSRTTIIFSVISVLLSVALLVTR